MLIDVRTSTQDCFGTQAVLNKRQPQQRRSSTAHVITTDKPNGFVFRFTAFAMICVTATYIGYSVFSKGVAVVG